MTHTMHSDRTATLCGIPAADNPELPSDGGSGMCPDCGLVDDIIEMVREMGTGYVRRLRDRLNQMKGL